MTQKGSLRSIKGAREKKKTFEAEVRDHMKSTTAQLKHVEENLGKAFSAMNSLMGASNAASLIVACVEKYLDREHPGWDEGMREEMKAKQAALAERKKLLQLAARPRKEGEEKERAELAEKIWETARRLGTEIHDGTIAISLLLQARDVERATAILEEVRNKADIPAELDEVFKKLEERISQVRKEDRRIWLPGDK